MNREYRVVTNTRYFAVEYRDRYSFLGFSWWGDWRCIERLYLTREDAELFIVGLQKHDAVVAHGWRPVTP